MACGIFKGNTKQGNYSNIASFVNIIRRFAAKNKTGVGRLALEGDCDQNGEGAVKLSVPPRRRHIASHKAGGMCLGM